MNRAMAEFELSFEDDGGDLAEPLAALLDDGLAQRGDCIVLARFADSENRRLDAERLGDETGVEAFVNHVHIEDELPPATATPAETLRQATRYVRRLTAMLETERPDRTFHIILSVSDSCVARFHTAAGGRGSRTTLRDTTRPCSTS